MNNLNDIIRECTRGDESSCKDLYNHFLPYVYGICKRYQISEGNIKDLLQIIFSSMFRSIHNYDATKSSFKTWFTRLAVNKIIEEKRKKYRAPIQEEISDYNKEILHYSEEKISSEMDRAYIMKILSKMPKNYQDVFNMSIIDGYTHREISEALGISVSSSRIILSRSREWARKALSNYLKYS